VEAATEAVTIGATGIEALATAGKQGSSSAHTF
jgi:hypothetical protein